MESTKITCKLFRMKPPCRITLNATKTRIYYPLPASCIHAWICGELLLLLTKQRKSGVWYDFMALNKANAHTLHVIFHVNSSPMHTM